jgi:hypothetical protein
VYWGISVGIDVGVAVGEVVEIGTVLVAWGEDVGVGDSDGEFAEEFKTTYPPKLATTRTRIIMMPYSTV